MMNNTTNTSNKIAQIIDSIEHSSVLDELKTQARWLPYRLFNNGAEKSNTEAKAISPESGKLISYEDTSEWRTFVEVRQAAVNFNADGVGFVFGDGYTSITLDATDDGGYDGVVPEIAKAERFFNSYTEWTHDRKLSVLCKVSESVENFELYSSPRNKQLKFKKTCNFAPVSGISYGNPISLSDRTGRIIYLQELFTLIEKDFLNYMNITCHNLHYAISEAAENFVKRCFENYITLLFDDDGLHMKAYCDCNTKTITFMEELLNSSRFLQAEVISKISSDCEALWYKLSNLHAQNLPCSLLDGAMAIVFGVDKYQLYR
ncbi:MAG: hypothetical protein IJ587_08370 [Synergistaceae bacterium]|nr:hypothetical protein [Synergistaceae bacterium]